MTDQSSMPDDAVQLANAFFALARAFDMPKRWQPGFCEVLRESFVTFGGELKHIASAIVDDAGDVEALERAYARLFLGPFSVVAPPWASYYLEPQRQLLGEVSEYAAQAYVEAGLVPGTDRIDVPDHVAHELEFMYFLAFQEASTGESIWRERQTAFWGEHLGQWLARFARSVRDGAGDSEFYRRLGDLTATFSHVVEARLRQ